MVSDGDLTLPRLSEELIYKYLSDLKLLGMLDEPEIARSEAR
jgi:hypothetical protein